MPTIGRSARFRLPLLGLLVVLLPGGCGLIGRSGPPVDRSQDPRILQEVEARLLREPSLDADLIRVEVDGGVVMLHGTVRGIGAWRCALRNAEMVPGVQTVVDYLLLERGPRDVRCLAPAPPTDGTDGDP